MQSLEAMIKDIQGKYVDKDKNIESTSQSSEENFRQKMDAMFEERMGVERKKGPITDKRYNSLCNRFSIEFGYDFSHKKITVETKHYRDANIRAESVKKEVEIAQAVQPNALQRLYFSAFSPSALEVIVKSKVRPKSCAIYSFFTLNCIIASGIAKVSKYEILEKLDLSHRNAPSYFDELADTGLIVDRSNHRNRKEESCFYLPHTHQNAKAIFNDQENTGILGGGDWVLMTPEAVEILTNEKRIHGTHWYAYAHLCLNTYRETGVTMRALSKSSIMKDLNPCASRKTIYRVFETLEELGLVIQEKHKKDVFFLPHILRKFAELAVKNGT